MQNDSTILYRDIHGFPGYRVGNDGSIWSCWSRRHCQGVRGGTWVIGNKWEIMRPGIRNGYYIITLRGNGKARTFSVHILVLIAFIGPRPKGMVSCHYPDRNRTNNNISNLSWGTPKVNQSHRRIHGTNGIKLSETDVKNIRDEYKYGEISQVRLAKKHGLHRTTVGLIINGKSWK